MTEPSPRAATDRSLPGRLLGALDRVPGLGGGRTHIICLALFFFGSLAVYLTVLKIRGPAGESLKTRIEWDGAFPFTPIWTWVYLLPYVAGPLIAAALRRPVFTWYLGRGAIVVLVSLVIFSVLPTQTVRPLEDPAVSEQLGDDLTARLYRYMVMIDDPPANAAPSLHVSLSCLLAWALFYDRPRLWWLALLLAVVVWLSTLYTAQHHLIDVVTGALLASLAAIGGPRVSPAAAAPPGESP